MLSQFKLEQQNFLQHSKKPARSLTQIIIKLKVIKNNWVKFIELSVQTIDEFGEEELNRRIERQIDQMVEITRSVDDIKPQDIPGD